MRDALAISLASRCCWAAMPLGHTWFCASRPRCPVLLGRAEIGLMSFVLFFYFLI
jgi:hypothetical protein